jgi:hypothetical protein
MTCHLDVMLPGIDGFVVAELRKQRRFAGC